MIQKLLQLFNSFDFFQCDNLSSAVAYELMELSKFGHMFCNLVVTFGTSQCFSKSLICHMLTELYIWYNKLYVQVIPQVAKRLNTGNCRRLGYTRKTLGK